MWDGWEWTYSTNNPAHTNAAARDTLDNLGKPDGHLLAITPIGYSAKEPPVPPGKERQVRWLGF